jgi:hypothetical protein
MRRLIDSPGSEIPGVRLPLALILSAVTLAVWGVAGLTIGLTLLGRWGLALALQVPVRLVLAPLALAGGSWPDSNGSWLRWLGWRLEPWAWLFRCWMRWPWLCWSSLRRPAAARAARSCRQTSSKAGCDERK